MAAVEPTSTQNFGKPQEPREPNSPPTAMPGTSVSKFDYRIQDYEHAISAEDLNIKLDTLGADGWRLIFFGPRDATHSRALFIREYPQ